MADVVPHASGQGPVQIPEDRRPGGPAAPVRIHRTGRRLVAGHPRCGHSSTTTRSPAVPDHALALLGASCVIEFPPHLERLAETAAISRLTVAELAHGLASRRSTGPPPRARRRYREVLSDFDPVPIRLAQRTSTARCGIHTEIGQEPPTASDRPDARIGRRGTLRGLAESQPDRLRPAGVRPPTSSA